MSFKVYLPETHLYIYIDIFVHICGDMSIDMSGHPGLKRFHHTISNMKLNKFIYTL